MVTSKLHPRCLYQASSTSCHSYICLWVNFENRFHQKDMQEVAGAFAGTATLEMNKKCHVYGYQSRRAVVIEEHG